MVVLCLLGSVCPNSIPDVNMSSGGILLKMIGFRAATCAYCHFGMLYRLHRRHAVSIGGPRLCVINNVISNQSISVLS